MVITIQPVMVPLISEETVLVLYLYVLILRSQP